MVGRAFVQVLEEEKIKAKYYFFASARSAGTKMKLLGKEYTVIELSKENIEKAKPDFALFSAGGSVSLEYAPVFNAIGCTVIDNSSAFRQDPKVPLVVPEVNPEDIYWVQGSPLIANPNCSTIGSVVALKPLDDVYRIKRVIYSTYQAVSGAGQAGVEDYIAGAKDGKDAARKKFPYPIFNNLIPQIDSFLPNGNTKEEEKMIFETKKILHRPDLAVTATCCRVPIENCHSISINVEFEKTPDIEDVKQILSKAPGIVFYDNPAENKYPMPIVANNRNEVFVGRVRIDNSRKNCINMFTVSDNIRKGAATNAVQILQLLIK